MPAPGRELILYGYDTGGNLRAIGEQTNFAISSSAATTEFGHKLSASKVVLTSSVSHTITCDAGLVYGDPGQTVIETAFAERNPVQLLLRGEGVDRYRYNAMVTSLNITAPEEGAATFQATLQTTGDPIKLY